ncbi:MAG: hypothetical protein HOE62_05170 [Alphaproteobacteria bacterium]|jgi:hypothetical protein|nr:hypothetical protein [Alphaproteobacteria bacterium]MBT4017318.1 hypothetical protein [Alphaproteobacteria bacterium]MBT4965607.1 hypothetical protein [Alphaproteobacteria bacterium]MBT5161225.1 hypothetical protein [Alphaproteobacteria bacterium]MBT5917644.1 hypothetical protein [Alphaproteobacteria bacterium]
MLNAKKMMITGALGCLLTLGAVPALADDATDMVVDKMSEGDVSAICQGGRSTISAAAKAAVTALATAGQISGDYQAIGQAAGSAFYQAKCG